MTALFVWFGCRSLRYREFLTHNIWLLIVAIVVNLVCLYSLIYSRTLARKVPINFILLGIFTISESYLVSSITIEYDPKTILIATFLTATIVVALTIYAFTTRTDFTMMGGLLFTVLSALIMMSFLCIFFPSKIFRTIISAFSVVLFSIYLIYDTQLILGKGELQLTVDDYIFAAMNLYLDILNIFLELLRLLGDN